MTRLKLIVASLLLFALLCSVRQMSWVLALDQWFYEGARELSLNGIWLRVLGSLTIFGNGEVVYGLSGLIILLIIFNKPSAKTFSLIPLMAILFLTNTFMKNVFGLDRPVGLAPFYPEHTTYTFPSGHAFNSVMFFYFFPRFVFGLDQHFEKLNLNRVLSFWRLPYLAPVGCCVIALSRVFLGVHWFSDVVTGLVLGFFVSQILLNLSEWAFETKLQWPLKK